MQKLTVSLLLVVVLAVLGLGWGIDELYNSQYAPAEDPAIKNYKQMGRDLMQLVTSAGIDSAGLEHWADESGTQLQFTAYEDFPLPPDLKKSFEQGEPLVLESGTAISLHYFLPSQQKVISFNLPAARVKQNTRLSWLLTLLFYSGVILIVLIWLYPLLKRLNLLRQQANAFGSGNLSARIPAGVSYIADIENEFNRMAQRIEDLVYDNKLLSRGLSHDLRTPIARLRFGLDVLHEAELSPAQQKTLAHLNRDLIAMENLVETLLSYARMDEAKVNVNPVKINIVEWLAYLLHEFYESQVEFNVIGDHAAANILADTEYLSMLIHNLIQNAARHGAGKIIVRVGVESNQICLSVEDNGPGIPPEERENVLKPFYRVASAQNTQGHGMGLAIVQRIAQWHKASLELAESSLLGGLSIKLVFHVAE